MMYRGSSGVGICEPTKLYNLLTRCNRKPAVIEANYLLLLDVRSREDYEHNHCILARHIKEVKNDNEGEDVNRYPLPFGVDITTVLHCIVYDGNTVSLVEDTPAIRLATELSEKGSKNPVLVLKGGYERFSAEYPFLRTQKILYMPTELEHLPHYPSEIIPHLLYLGDERHAYNPSLNYDMRIKGHVNSSADLYTAWPDTITELHVSVQDESQTNLLEWFDEVSTFIDTYRKRSEAVLVFGNKGISRSASLVIAYLMYYKKLTYQDAFEHVKSCRPHIKPLKSFEEQLMKWEEKLTEELRNKQE